MYAQTHTSCFSLKRKETRTNNDRPTNKHLTFKQQQTIATSEHIVASFTSTYARMVRMACLFDITHTEPHWHNRYLEVRRERLTYVQMFREHERAGHKASNSLCLSFTFLSCPTFPSMALPILSLFHSPSLSLDASPVLLRLYSIKRRLNVIWEVVGWVTDTYTPTRTCTQWRYCTGTCLSGGRRWGGWEGGGPPYDAWHNWITARGERRDSYPVGREQQRTFHFDSVGLLWRLDRQPLIKRLQELCDMFSLFLSLVYGAIKAGKDQPRETSTALKDLPPATLCHWGNIEFAAVYRKEEKAKCVNTDTHIHKYILI